MLYACQTLEAGAARNPPRYMSRSTIHLALVQVLVGVLGFVGLAAVLKLSGYPQEMYVRWNPVAIFLRQHPLLPLILPLVWTVFAVLSERVEQGVLSSSLTRMIGVGIVLAVLGIFFYAALQPYTRPIIIGR